jgi:hypothetical protein
VVNNQKHRFKGAILKLGCKDRDLFWEKLNFFGIYFLLIQWLKYLFEEGD